MILMESEIPQPNHILHGVLTLVTGLAWLPIWVTVMVCHNNYCQAAANAK
jgi:hypothetical protein